jgi:hypothetical protein
MSALLPNSLVWAVDEAILRVPFFVRPARLGLAFLCNAMYHSGEMSARNCSGKTCACDCENENCQDLAEFVTDTVNTGGLDTQMGGMQWGHVKSVSFSSESFFKTLKKESLSGLSSSCWGCGSQWYCWLSDFSAP